MNSMHTPNRYPWTRLEVEMGKYLEELGYDAQGSASVAGGRTLGAAGAGGKQR